MKTRWIGVATTALIVCAAPAWARDEKRAHPATTRAVSLTASAWAALGKGDARKAVEDAEAAVRFSPNDAGTRALLGRAYLAAGRFTSAETAFGDALTLDPALSRAHVNRALAQIALGKPDEARASLASATGNASDSDVGLAMALMGDSEAARTLLNSAARAPGADARARQNLGLALALEGRWTDAAAVASQDVAADMMPQRLRRWAMIAQLKADPAMQVGAVLGVLPAEDAGQPAALALARPSAPPAELALAPAAQAEIPTVVVMAPASPPPFVASVAPAVRHEGGSVVTQTAFTPPSFEHPAAANDAPPPISTVAALPEPAAWAGPPLMRKARVVEIAAPPVVAKPARKDLQFAVKPTVPRGAPNRPIVLASALSLRSLPATAGGNWAVQLGAFSSMRRTETAWSELGRKANFLGSYQPTGSGRRWGKATLYGLSVSGLATRRDAVNLCVRIKAVGGSCFVRNASGDRPMLWALNIRSDVPA